MGKRGEITEDIRKRATEDIRKRAEQLFGYKIGVIELRLMPYIMQVMTEFNQRIDSTKINELEREVLKRWKADGYIKGEIVTGFSITKEFWDIISELVFMAYVDMENKYKPNIEAENIPTAPRP